MAMPKDMELLDLEYLDSGKVGKSPSRKFQRKKNAAKRNAVDNELKEDLSPVWEVYSGSSTSPQDPARDDGKDSLENIRGFLLKKRKWPLKGFHKRYFILEDGILSYGRSLLHMNKGKLHGQMDMSVAVISVNQSMKHIDIDGGEHSVYHLKTKTLAQYEAWLTHLQQHRLYRQSQVSGSGVDPGLIASMTTGSGEKSSVRPDWMKERIESLDRLKEDISLMNQNLEAMNMFLSELLPFGFHSNGSDIPSSSDSNSATISVSQLETPKKKKFGKSKKKASTQPDLKPSITTSDVPPVELVPPEVLQSSRSLSNITERHSSSTESNQLWTSFIGVAGGLYQEMCDVVKKMETEQTKMKQTLEKEYQLRVHYQVVTANLQTNITRVLAQNNEYRETLNKIQTLCGFVGVAKDFPKTSSVGFDHPPMSTPLSTHIPMSHSLRSTSVRSGSMRNVERVGSFMSVAGSSWSGTEFYDAQEELVLSNVPSSEENSEEELVYSEDESDYEEPMDPVTPTDPTPKTIQSDTHQRRKQLPCPQVEAGPGLWSLLRKHIGKDLSRVSMPVTMNEPLSALQRLCEEMQYSSLLQEAAGLEDPYDRMVRVAVFAVSSYADTQHRAGSKPFNPILGETFECIREDKGFRFIAEQVSHHPPIAACHVESDDYVLWQDAQLKSKYWGRSFEVIPIGTVNVTIPKYADHYKWDKVTTCIYNIMGGQRSVDHYGTMKITNGNQCYCKLTFYKTAGWSSKTHYVRGSVFDVDDQEVRHIYGHWQTALYCGNEGSGECIWTASPLPLQYVDYFGFTQFAIELNELEAWTKDQLPCTDCRFRTDQRMLENGQVEEAQKEKERIEQMQRDARAERQSHGEEWSPNFFERKEVDGKERWVFSGNYWTLRKNKFRDIKLPVLW